MVCQKTVCHRTVCHQTGRLPTVHLQTVPRQNDVPRSGHPRNGAHQNDHPLAERLQNGGHRAAPARGGDPGGDLQSARQAGGHRACCRQHRDRLRNDPADGPHRDGRCRRDARRDGAHPGCRGARRRCRAGAESAPRHGVPAPPAHAAHHAIPLGPHQLRPGAIPAWDR